MMDITTPTEIARITAMIRAGYLGQRVFIGYDEADAIHLKPRHLESSIHLYGYLLLIDLSSITDKEAIEIGKTRFPNASHLTDELFCDLGYKTISDFLTNGKLSWLMYQYLQQHSFALPFYDTLTRQTITVSQQVEMGIIKIKT